MPAKFSLDIDTGDEEILALVNKEKSKRAFRIHGIATPKLDGYWTLWKSYNELVKLGPPNTQFFIELNDECRFATHHWDKILTKFVNHYSDNVFHL